jgi:hypothetical protein
MRFKTVIFLSTFACLLLAVSALAQGSDSISGVWTGDWGPSQYDRNNVTLELKWDGKALSGNITGGTNVAGAIPLQKTSFDPKTGVIHMEADVRGRGGATIHYVVDGKVEKGSMTGSWNHDNRKGDFKLTKK